MRTYHRGVWLVAALLFMAPACTNQSAEQPKVSQLTGEYRIVSGERNGLPIEASELDQATITIAKNVITAYDKERKETYAATYTLETDRTPWHITMTSTKAPETGVVSQGLIHADHGQVKLVYALPNGQAPTDFKTGEQQQMFVLARTDSGPGERGQG